MLGPWAHRSFTRPLPPTHGYVSALGAWGADIDNFLSILLLRQESNLVQGTVPAQG